MAVQEIAISIGLTILGVAFGMDKSHDWRDWVGPLIVAAAFIYAIMAGLYLLAAVIGVILFIKVISR